MFDSLSENLDLNELVKRAVKYLVEGIMVAIAAYAIPQKSLKLDEIEKRDDNLSDFIFSFINIKSLRSKIKKNDNNYIKIKNKSYGNIYVYFNDKCTFIDSIVIDRMKNKFNIKNISVNSIDDPSNIDSLFTLDIDEKEVFKYDLR